MEIIFKHKASPLNNHKNHSCACFYYHISFNNWMTKHQIFITWNFDVPTWIFYTKDSWESTNFLIIHFPFNILAINPEILIIFSSFFFLGYLFNKPTDYCLIIYSGTMIGYIEAVTNINSFLSILMWSKVSLWNHCCLGAYDQILLGLL